MTKAEFKAFLVMLMCSDPNTPQILIDWANGESLRHGCADWIDAYHKL